jgi:AraC-like DNA-binding protein
VTIILDARQLPEADRFDGVHAAIASTFVPVKINFADDGGPPSVYGAVTDIGPMTVLSVRSNAVTVERTQELARDDLTPSIFVGLQLQGSSLVVQDGREAVLRPGELVVYDSTAPYALADDDGIRQHQFRIPLDRLGLSRDAIRHVCAVTLSPGDPVADLAATYFHRLAAKRDLFDRPGAEFVSQPSIELIRAVISTHLDASALVADSFHNTLQLRIMEYIRLHLREPELSASQIAAAHHVSVRQLYKILAAHGIVLGEWIRTHRLEECRKEIGSAANSAIPIASVARRWGFTDPSSFARMFRTRYDMSPREWRDLNRSRKL